MKYLFLVPWIEVEFGSRPEGFKVFATEQSCIEESKKDCLNGNYPSGGGYCGPEKPPCYYKVAFDEEFSKKAFVNNLPELHSNKIYIT